MNRRELLQAGAAISTFAFNVGARPADDSPRRPMVPDDINRLRTPGALSLSPDAQVAVFVCRSLATNLERFESSLWACDISHDRLRQLTSGPEDTQPACSPDGRTVAFLRKVAGKPQVFLTSLEGGEARLFVELPDGVSSIAWSPDGLTLAVSGPTGYGDTRQKDADRTDGVHVFTRANYQFEGLGFVDYDRPEQIWLARRGSPGPGSVVQLTRGRFAAQGAAWSADGLSLFYVCDETDERYYEGSKPTLYTLRIETGERRAISRMGGRLASYLEKATRLSVSPDGTRIAYVTRNPDAPQFSAKGELFVMDLATGQSRRFTREHAGDLAGTDLLWLDEHRLLALSSFQATQNLLEVDLASGNTVWRTQGEHAIERFAAAEGGDRLVVVRSNPVEPAELHLVGEGGRLRQLSHLNAVLMGQVQLSMPEIYWYKTADGQNIHAFLYKPPGFNTKKRWPLVLSVHGGPYIPWTLGFGNEHPQVVAGAGYLVLQINPRGSASYGQAFASALSQWPGGVDYEDLMAGVEDVVSRPYVDAARLGIVGASVGGTITDWAISHSNRFAAAVSVSDIADFDQLWFEGDQAHFEKDAPPFTHPDRIERGAPLLYVANIKTPTMFMYGTADARVPPSTGAKKMFRSLKFLHVPTVLVQFDGAGHAIERSTNQKHYSMRIRHTIRWFDRFLKGVPAPEYDVVLSEET